MYREHTRSRIDGHTRGTVHRVACAVSRPPNDRVIWRWWNVVGHGFGRSATSERREEIVNQFIPIRIQCRVVERHVLPDAQHHRRIIQEAWATVHRYRGGRRDLHGTGEALQDRRGQIRHGRCAAAPLVTDHVAGRVRRQGEHGGVFRPGSADGSRNGKAGVAQIHRHRLFTTLWKWNHLCELR